MALSYVPDIGIRMCMDHGMRRHCAGHGRKMGRSTCSYTAHADYPRWGCSAHTQTREPSVHDNDNDITPSVIKGPVHCFLAKTGLEKRGFKDTTLDYSVCEGASMAWEGHANVPTLSYPNSMHVMSRPRLHR